jgi:hypothetical protein
VLPQFDELSVPALKLLLRERGVDFCGCVEQAELVALLCG